MKLRIPWQGVQRNKQSKVERSSIHIHILLHLCEERDNKTKKVPLTQKECMWKNNKTKLFKYDLTSPSDPFSYPASLLKEFISLLKLSENFQFSHSLTLTLCGESANSNIFMSMNFSSLS